ncbi:MAG TPA: CBS domain-containing protein [Solirubrobacter sp.]|nr:CBS domain-containing protein [Solirubrobacter sp.]
MSSTIHIPLDEAGPTIGDVMMRGAETVGPALAVAEARKILSPRKKLLLVAEGDHFLGTITAAELPDGDGPIGPHVRADAPRVTPGDPVGRALELAADGMTRIPVVDPGDRLVGLVCFNSTHEAFCIYPS